MNAVLDTAELKASVAKAILGLDGAVTAGVEKAAEHVEQSAKAKHGYQDRTGALTRSITAEPVKGALFAGGLHGDVSADAGHAAFVHGGTKAHKIRARRAKALRFQAGGGVVFRAAVNHPGTEPEPFLAEALERELDTVGGHVLDSALDALEAAGFEVSR